MVGGTLFGYSINPHWGRHAFIRLFFFFQSILWLIRIGNCFSNPIERTSPETKGNAPGNWEELEWSKMVSAIVLCNIFFQNKSPRCLSWGGVPHAWSPLYFHCVRETLEVSALTVNNSWILLKSSAALPFVGRLSGYNFWWLVVSGCSVQPSPPFGFFSMDITQREQLRRVMPRYHPFLAGWSTHSVGFLSQKPFVSICKPDPPLYWISTLKTQSSRYWCQKSKITETSPRSPDIDSAPENYVATYINIAISKLVNLIQAFALSHIYFTHIKDGYYDMVWASFIDALWQGGIKPGLYLARSPLSQFDGLSTLHIHLKLALQHAWKPLCPIIMPLAMPIWRKITRALVSILCICVGYKWEIARRLEVFGFVTCMSFAPPHYCVMRKSRTFSLPLNGYAGLVRGSVSKASNYYSREGMFSFAPDP